MVFICMMMLTFFLACMSLIEKRVDVKRHEQGMHHALSTGHWKGAKQFVQRMGEGYGRIITMVPARIVIASIALALAGLFISQMRHIDKGLDSAPARVFFFFLM